MQGREKSMINRLCEKYKNLIKIIGSICKNVDFQKVEGYGGIKYEENSRKN